MPLTMKKIELSNNSAAEIIRLHTEIETALKSSIENGILAGQLLQKNKANDTCRK